MKPRRKNKPGAGRPKIDRPKVRLSLRVGADVAEYLGEQANRTVVVEAAVRESVGYREWSESQPK